MLSFTKKEQIVILLLVASIIILLGYNILKRDEIQITTENEVIPNVEDSKELENDINKDNEEIEEKIIMVHISGQVSNPGLVVLKEGDRVIDAVEKAGGLKGEADFDRINLAKKLSDEEKVYIPKIGEKTDVDFGEEDKEASEEDSSQNKKININSASKAEIESLPGIGEALAQRIIEYRKNKKFETVEELVNVSGIGEKKLEAIRHLIIAE